MMETWRTIRLGSACTTNSATYSPKEKWEFVNYLDTGNITNNRIDSIQYIDVESEKLPSRARRKVKTNSIIYSTVRPNQRHFGIIKSQPDNFLVSTGFAVIDVKPETLDADYLYYVLTQDSIVEKLHAIAEQSTSAYPSIKSSDIEDLEIEVPDLATQKKIAGILGELDRKAKQNAEINKNLQEQAQSLYENLIADDQASTLVSLADLMDYAGGSQPPASEFIFEEREGYVRFVQIRDYDNDSHITYIPVSSRNKLCEEHDIMIARYGASLGRICAGINGAYNVALAKVFPKQPHYREFLRCYLSSRTFYEGINNRGSRSAQAGFNQSDINSFLLAVPSDEKLHQFESIASALFEQRLNLQHENQELSELRDTLLPKLMSGEIDTSAIDF